MLKAAIIGAGSTYTPELIEGFTDRREELPFDTFALMDIDQARLDIVGGLAKRQLLAAGLQEDKIILTTDLARALDGANFIFAQIRVGKMPLRVIDEKIPQKYGLLGQETTGAGGFMKALRTIPVMLDLAKAIKQYAAPDAWLINFSNPSGIIAEALLNHTDIKMLGLCNCSINMLKEVEKTLGTAQFDYEYLGLNHLSWITSVKLKQGQHERIHFAHLPDAADSGEGETENLVAELSKNTGGTMKNVPEIEYDPALLRAIPYIPSSYLSYFYAREEQIKKCQDAEKTRGEICLELENSLLEKFSDPKLDKKPEELEKRGGALYSTAAASAAAAIYNDHRALHVVATKNNGAIPFMDASDVVELPCVLGKDGVTPKPVSVYNDYIVGLMRAVKSYEKLTVKAAMTGDRDAALAALMVHPLIGDYAKAKPMLDEMLKENLEYLPKFSLL